jgi:hypothetical protein
LQGCQIIFDEDDSNNDQYQWSEKFIQRITELMEQKDKIYSVVKESFFDNLASTPVTVSIPKTFGKFVEIHSLTELYKTKSEKLTKLFLLFFPREEACSGCCFFSF